MKGIYQYPIRNFPECREQFSFSSDSEDYLLFGGNSTRVFGDLWIFDPSK